MRISDWSSDVCSSDLLQRRLRRHPRQQRKASMTIPQKRHIVSNLKIKEISSVDNPAQVGVTAVLIKRADGDLTEIRKNAAAVAAGEQPKFGVADYEDAMFACAAELAKDMQCTPEQALLKGLPTDPALRDLAHASAVARVRASADEVRKRQAAARNCARRPLWRATGPERPTSGHKT